MRKYANGLILGAAFGVVPAEATKTPPIINELKVCVAGAVNDLYTKEIVGKAVLENIKSGIQKLPHGLKREEYDKVQSCMDEYTLKMGEAKVIADAKEDYRKTYIRGSKGEIIRKGNILVGKDGNPLAVENPENFKYFGSAGYYLWRERIRGTVNQYDVNAWNSEIFYDGKNYYRFNETYKEEDSTDERGRLRGKKTGATYKLKKIHPVPLPNDEVNRLAEFGGPISIHPTGFYITQKDGSIKKVVLPAPFKDVHICAESGEWDCHYLLINGKKYHFPDEKGRVVLFKKDDDGGNIEPKYARFRTYPYYLKESRKNMQGSEWTIEAGVINEKLDEHRYQKPTKNTK